MQSVATVSKTLSDSTLTVSMQESGDLMNRRAGVVRLADCVIL